MLQTEYGTMSESQQDDLNDLYTTAEGVLANAQDAINEAESLLAEVTEVENCKPHKLIPQAFKSCHDN